MKAFLSVIFSFAVLLCAHPQKSHAKTGVCHGAFSGSTSFLIAVPKIDGKPIKPAYHPLLKVLATSSAFRTLFSRCVASQITNHKKLQRGFTFTFIEHNGTILVDLILPPKDSEQSGTIDITDSYDEKSEFYKKLLQFKKREKLSASDSIRYRSANDLPNDKIAKIVSPIGPYLSIYDFLRDASSEELESFWVKVYEISKEIRAKGKSYRLISHAGSRAGQSVSHFQMQFEVID